MFVGRVGWLGGWGFVRDSFPRVRYVGRILVPVLGVSVQRTEVVRFPSCGCAVDACKEFCSLGWGPQADERA